MIENLIVEPPGSAANDKGLTPVAPPGEAFMVNLVVLLCFFPFFRYLPLGDVESQPAASIVALLALALFEARESLVVRAILALAITIMGLTCFSILGLNVAPAAALQQAVAYLAPLPIVAFLWGRLHLLSVRITLASGGSYLLLGALQAFGLVPGFLDSLLSQSISRYQSSFVGGGRGVVMFAPEPDYASRQIVLFTAICLYLVLARRLSRATGTAAAILCGLAMLALNRSITGIAIFFALLAFSAVARVNRRRLFLFGGVAAALAYTGWHALASFDLSDVTQDQPRVVQLAAGVAQAAARESFGLADVAQFASARAVTSLAAIRAAPSVIWIGGGIGRSEAIVIAAIQNDPLLQGINFRSEDFGNLKPQSWVAAFVLEGGVFGSLLFLMTMVAVWREVFGTTMSLNERALAFGCFATAMLQLVLLGPHSLPAPWLLLVVAGAIPLIGGGQHPAADSKSTAHHA